MQRTWFLEISLTMHISSSFHQLLAQPCFASPGFDFQVQFTCCGGLDIWHDISWHSRFTFSRSSFPGTDAQRLSVRNTCENWPSISLPSPSGRWSTFIAGSSFSWNVILTNTRTAISHDRENGYVNKASSSACFTRFDPKPSKTAFARKHEISNVWPFYVKGTTQTPFNPPNLLVQFMHEDKISYMWPSH